MNDATLTATIGGDYSPFSRALQEVKRETSTFAASIKSTLGVTAAGFAAATAPLVAAASYGMKFERQMSMVRAVVNPTIEDFKQMKDVAKELGATTEKTATEVGAAMQMLGQAGFDTQQIIESAAAVIDMSTLTQTDMATSTQVLTNALHMFNLEANKAGEVASTFAMTQSKTNTNVIELAEGMRYVGGTAHNLGYDLKTTSAALGLLANQALKGSIGGTSLNQALLHLVKPSKDGAAIMKKYGIAMFDATGKIRGLDAVLQDVTKAQLGQKEMVELFGIRGVRSFNALVNAEVKYEGKIYKGAEALRVLTKQLQDNTEYAAKQATVVRSDTTGAFEMFYSAVEGAAIALYDKFQPALKHLVNDGLVPMVRGFRQWMRDSEGLQKYLDGFFKMVQSGADSMAALGQNMGPAMDAMFGAIGDALPDLKAWMEPWLLWVKEIGPQLPGLIRQTADDLGNLWAQSKDGLQLLKDLVVGAGELRDFLRPIGDVLKMIREGWVNLGTAVAEVADRLGDAYAKVFDFNPEQRAAAMQKWFDSIRAMFSDAGEWAKGAANVAAVWADSMVVTLQKRLKSGLNSALTGWGDYLIGHSPPKKGPLKNIDKGGQNLGKAWTKGVLKGLTGGTKQMNTVLKEGFKDSVVAVAQDAHQIESIWSRLAQKLTGAFFSGPSYQISNSIMGVTHGGNKGSVWQTFGRNVLGGWLGGLFSSQANAGKQKRRSIWDQMLSGIATGGIVPAFASGGIVTSPTLALVGERGPERIQPLTGSSAAGGVNITIIDQRPAGSPELQVSETTSGDGMKEIEVLITSKVQDGILAGNFDNEMAYAFNVQRKGLRR